MLYGRYEHTIDAKNRVFIPAKYKDALGTNFKITYNKLLSPCILVYSEEEWQEMQKKIKGLPSLQCQFFIREICSNTVDVQLDSQGRIVIPQYLKDKVGLEKNALFLGVGNHAEIWAPDVLEQKNAEVDLEELKRAMIDIGF
ncbi:MAG: division/cell wall cluster transcriptional repressor MraZ [Clostridia bacterium]|nr:division/cell wall cluster transcriptional repressor MraZ [Clostridia bacterium]